MADNNSRSNDTDPNQGARARRRNWAWLMPVLLLAPLELGAKGCDSAVVGDDCPVGSTSARCTAGAGGGSTGGAANKGGATGKGGNTSAGNGGAEQLCGGLLGAQCDKGEYCDFPLSAQCGAADQPGVCRSLPQACTTEFNPVCGCDDVTYGNRCAAAAAGVSVASEGECGTTPADACGGLLGLECGKGEFCDYPLGTQCGAADQTGVCRVPPEVCTDQYEPVCGCDGKTYGNDCEAAAAGVSAAAKGECGTPTPGTCNAKEPSCGAGTYCEFSAGSGCGASGKEGSCVEIPEACDAILKPVCGCDGVTYSSSCVAAMKGVSVASEGECGATPSNACGGLRGLTCAKGEFCDYPVGTKCGAADQQGVCRVPPDACTEQYDPVCGCDGKTYSNACFAAAAGMSVATKGECATTPGRACGARLGDTCAKTEFCSFPPSAICGRADATGTCAPRPTGCTKELNETCGCDGVIYGNPCMANLAGVSADPENLCKQQPPTGAVCGGLTGGAACAKDEYCAFPVDAQCGAADQTGNCALKPEGCTLQYDPVCGCDGKTYGNACEAASAGVSIFARGACK